MGAKIPDNLRDLVERPIVAGLATLMPSGQPQVTPVWFNYDGEYVIVNTARGRQKDANMEDRAKVTLLVIDPSNPYHWLEMRGTVVATDDSPAAVDVIHQLAIRYTGQDFSANLNLNPAQVRVTYKIELTKVNGD